MCIACDAKEIIQQEYDWNEELLELAVDFGFTVPDMDEMCHEHALEALVDRALLACAFAHFAEVNGGLPENMKTVPTVRAVEG